MWLQHMWSLYAYLNHNLGEEFSKHEFLPFLVNNFVHDTYISYSKTISLLFFQHELLGLCNIIWIFGLFGDQLFKNLFHVTKYELNHNPHILYKCFKTLTRFEFLHEVVKWILDMNFEKINKSMSYMFIYSRNHIFIWVGEREQHT
jgi:hypothetical protein